MIAKIKAFNRKRRKNKLIKQLHSKAIISEPFEISQVTTIANESESKDNIIIGHHCRLDGSFVCKSTGKIEIGNYTWIGAWAEILCNTHIKIGHYCSIASYCTVVDNNNHPTDPVERIKHRIRVAPEGEGYPGIGNGWELSDSAPIVVEDNVWVGSQSVVLKGVTIGEGSIIARNSVVTKDVPPYTVVAGVPARVVKELEKPNYKYYEI